MDEIKDFNPGSQVDVVFTSGGFCKSGKYCVKLYAKLLAYEVQRVHTQMKEKYKDSEISQIALDCLLKTIVSFSHPPEYASQVEPNINYKLIMTLTCRCSLAEVKKNGIQATEFEVAAHCIRLTYEFFQHFLNSHYVRTYTKTNIVLKKVLETVDRFINFSVLATLYFFSNILDYYTNVAIKRGWDIKNVDRLEKLTKGIKKIRKVAGTIYLARRMLDFGVIFVTQGLIAAHYGYQIAKELLRRSFRKISELFYTIRELVTKKSNTSDLYEYLTEMNSRKMFTGEYKRWV